MSPITENFEDRLLRELQQYVADRPAETPARVIQPGSGRRWLVPAAGFGVAAAAAGVLVAIDAGSPSPAYAVERAGDGTVTVEIRSMRDAAGLERELREAGVRAQVDYLEPGTMCREPRFTAARGKGPFSVGHGVRADGTATFTVDARQLSATDTLVVTASGTPDGGPTSVSTGIASGDIAPCEPVKGTAPAQEPVPAGGGTGERPRLDEGSDPAPRLEQRQG